MGKETMWDKLVCDNELCKIKNLRLKTYYEKKDNRNSLSELQKDGWIPYKEYKDKRFIGIRKPKLFDELFEDRVSLIVFATI